MRETHSAMDHNQLIESLPLIGFIAVFSTVAALHVGFFILGLSFL